jgi:hypothetical protein
MAHSEVQANANNETMMNLEVLASCGITLQVPSTVDFEKPIVDVCKQTAKVLLIILTLQQQKEVERQNAIDAQAHARSKFTPLELALIPKRDKYEPTGTPLDNHICAASDDLSKALQNAGFVGIPYQYLKTLEEKGLIREYRCYGESSDSKMIGYIIDRIKMPEVREHIKKWLVDAK